MQWHTINLLVLDLVAIIWIVAAIRRSYRSLCNLRIGADDN